MSDTAPFGFQDVPAAEKASLVRRVFDSVADRYDVMNDLMSLGVHRLWKSDLVASVHPRAGELALDVAGGTGDVAAAMVAAAPGMRAIICDINAAMVERGRDRLIDDGRLPGLGASGIALVVGDAEALPFPDRSIDIYTVAFGLRNVTRLGAALAEARRVLRPGGRFFCLEFSHVVLPGLDRLYDLYSFSLLPALGQAVTGDRDAYAYLVESIRRFPTQPDFARSMAEAGLDRPRWRNLSGGIAAIHSAWRL
ncbi:MAG: class I SAM-dependent methyltransferase [Alphaproteobacteria bacterium]|nr:class I SAM-dependent methyltransferase [Alphaproteobacteria bacterium]